MLFLDKISSGPPDSGGEGGSTAQSFDWEAAHRPWLQQGRVFWQVRAIEGAVRKLACGDGDGHYTAPCQGSGGGSRCELTQGWSKGSDRLPGRSCSGKSQETPNPLETALL